MTEPATVQPDSIQGAVPQLMTAQEVSRILKIAPKTVNKLARERKIGSVQVTSKERRFTQEQVQAYIAQNSQPVRVDTEPSKPLFCPRKGGEKSFGVSKADLRKEMSQWQ
jgi:excisionase family DNA binding protein